MTDYIIKGKMWKLMALKANLKLSGIPSNYNPFTGSLLVRIKDGGELVVLQDGCKELNLTYKQF